MKKDVTKKLTITAVFIAIGVLLPSVFHLFNLGGPVFLPMHIPILICGLICGYKYGALCGLIVPLLSSVTTGMPPLFPVAIAMSLELAMYGFLTGLLKDKFNIYITLIAAQIGGRIVSAIANFVLLSVTGGTFAFTAFLTSVFVLALPGIILQIILVPVIVKLIKHGGVVSNA